MNSEQGRSPPPRALYLSALFPVLHPATGYYYTT